MDWRRNLGVSDHEVRIEPEWYFLSQTEPKRHFFSTKGKKEDTKLDVDNALCPLCPLCFSFVIIIMSL